METIEAILKDAETRMSKTLQTFKTEVLKIRTGRANPAILEGIRIDYYGTPIPLQQIATIASPEARLLVVQPWDKNVIGSIEKAIRSSGLGLNPVNDGNVLKIPIPPLSEDRRRGFVKLVKKLAEEARIAIRNIRRDAIDHVKTLEKNKEISEDDRIRAEDKIQDIHDKYIQEINQAAEKKEHEIMEE